MKRSLRRRCLDRRVPASHNRATFWISVVAPALLLQRAPAEVVGEIRTERTPHAMQVKQLMSTSVVRVPESTSCHDAVGLMARNRIRHLPVVDRNGRLCGVVTDRDLRHHLFTPEVFGTIGEVPVERLLSAVAVRDVMSSPAVCVGPDADVQEAARAMVEGKLGSLPVVEDGRLVGIVTETDVLRRILGEDACCADVGTIVVSYP
jgi:CBS domain-containing protein